MIVAPGYLGAIAVKGPVSLTVPSMIATAPAEITPDAPRRGSVIAYAPRTITLSVITFYPILTGLGVVEPAVVDSDAAIFRYGRTHRRNSGPTAPRAPD